jgi:hypothetical protein
MKMPWLSEHEVIEFGYGCGRDYYVTEWFDEVRHRWIQERYEKRSEEYELIQVTTINPYIDQLAQLARDMRSVR